MDPTPMSTNDRLPVPADDEPEDDRPEVVFRDYSGGMWSFREKGNPDGWIGSHTKTGLVPVKR